MSEPGRQLKFPKPGEVGEQYLRDVRLGQIEAGVSDPKVQQGTFIYAQANGFDNAHQALSSNISIASKNADENTATGEALDRIRDSLGLPAIAPSPSAGKVIVAITGTGLRTFQDGLLFTMPNGKSGKVYGTQMGIASGESINVISIDTGEDTNLDPGTKVKWSAPPINVQTEATVDASGLTGGTGEETDEKKRDRIRNKRQNLPASGNAAYVIELAEGADNSVQKAFVYAALGGPGSAKVVVQRLMDPDNDDFSKEVPDAKVSLVQSAILADMPTAFEIVVQSIEDELTDVALGITFANALDGRGFYNLQYWPILEASETKVSVSSATNTTLITVNALTTTAPTNGDTKIAWWCPASQSFVLATVIAHSGSSGAWVLTLDTPLTSSGSDVASGDYISPAGVSFSSYRDTWIAELDKLTPGQNQAILSASTRYARIPAVSQAYPTSLTSQQTNALQEAFTELLDVQYLYRSKTNPTVPVVKADPPKVLRLNRFGIYRNKDL